MKTYIHLTAEQGALYDQTVSSLLERMQKLEGIERKGAILATLTQFKRLCDHPALLTKEPLPELPGGGGLLDTEAVVNRSAKLEQAVHGEGTAGRRRAAPDLHPVYRHGRDDAAGLCIKSWVSPCCI